MIEIFRKLYFLLDARAKRHALILAFFMLIGAALEALGIGLIFPFVGVLSNPELLSESPKMRWVYEMSGTQDMNAFLTFFGAVLIAVFVLKNSYLAVLNYTQFRFVFASQISLSQRLLDHYLRVPYAFHLKNNSAQLLRNVTSEALWIFRNVVIPSMTVVSEILVALMVGLVLFIASPVSTVLAIALIGTAGGAFLTIIRRRTRVLGQQEQRHMGLMLQAVNQAFGSVKETKVYETQSAFLAEHRVSADAYSQANTYLKTAGVLPRLFLETLGATTVLLGCIFMVGEGAQIGTFLPHLGLFALAAVRLMPSANRIVSSLTTIRYFAASVDVVYDDLILNREDEEAVTGTGGRLQYADALELRNVSYSYPTAPRPSLNDVSLRIARGESVGFTGPSGAGKSTLVDVVLGLLHPQDGGIYVDGTNIVDNLRGWRRLISYVPQQVYLLDEPVRKNVAFGISPDEVDDEAVWNALRLAQLEKLVRSMPDGLDTIIGENGVKLSGGQRQRIGIARALYRRPEVLVLDEATSSLDSDTEQEISDAISKLRGELTLIIIAHRLTTLMDCNKIYMLNDSRLVASGTFEELRAENAEFQQLLRKSQAAVGVEGLSTMAETG